MYGDQYVFLCEYSQGEPQLHPESEEQKINKLGKNLYIPTWLPITDFKNAPFLSNKLQAKLLHALAHGWPEHPEEFASTGSV